MANTSPERGHYSKVDFPSPSARPVSFDSRDVPVQRKISRAPMIIVLALVVGLGVALAHHFTYTYLDDKALQDVSLPQEWISRFGFAMAFLVKLSFVVSVGAAFVQHQWLQFHSRPFAVREIDALTSVLGNLVTFMTSSVWLRQPVLAVLALISWLIPLSTIFIPGSLIVAPVINQTGVFRQVPQPFFDNPDPFGFWATGGANGELYTTAKLRTLAFATATSSQPISLQSYYQNESYALDFNAPAVKCGAAEASMTRNITATLGTCNTCPQSTPFASWVTGMEQVTTRPPQQQQQGLVPQQECIDQASFDGAHIYVMTNLNYNTQGTIPVNDSDPSGGKYYVVNLTECVLYNATYSVTFDFKYPNQTRQVSISKWLNTVSPVDLWFETAANYSESQQIQSYSLIMSSFGQLLVGYETNDQYGANNTYLTSWDMINIDWTDSNAVQTGLESLFQNITLSLLSDSAFIKNSSVATPVLVTYTSYPIKYIYKRLDLLQPYGLAFFATAICALVGLRAYFVNNASYQNLFSTFLRATAEDQDIRERFSRSTAGADAGADPLPKLLGEVKMRLGAGRGRED